jgi:proteasome component ECM29
MFAAVPEERLRKIIDTVIAEWAAHPLALSRQAAAAWLLSLLKLCGQLVPVQERLRNIQNAFLSLIGEPDDVIQVRLNKTMSSFKALQDLASKGLSLLYELGTDETKAILVEGLVSTLADGKVSTSQKFTQDSSDRVFEPGALGQTKDGAGMCCAASSHHVNTTGLSTYKELCSIASDLNKPDLIYKFMQLAKHNALWTSRRGAAFGFSRIAKQAHEHLKPHLSLLVPRLFRYD